MGGGLVDRGRRLRLRRGTLIGLPRLVHKKTDHGESGDQRKANGFHGLAQRSIGKVGEFAAWHGIMTAGLQGVASQQTLDRQSTAAHHAVGMQRLYRVLRATRSVSTARRQQRAEDALVTANQQDHDACGHPSFRRCRSSSEARNALALSSASPRLPVTTTSIPRKSLVRNHSRVTRLIRFRSTARLAHFLEMARPRRAGASTVVGATTSIHWRSWTRRPLRKTAR